MRGGRALGVVSHTVDVTQTATAAHGQPRWSHRGVVGLSRENRTSNVRDFVDRVKGREPPEISLTGSLIAIPTSRQTDTRPDINECDSLDETQQWSILLHVHIPRLYYFADPASSIVLQPT
ncbi:hypothetical protein EVAR_12225_1 [Eumeta japonica]|uniref:Uncharacterized protein n=1 Tax=Eumeta variegata TaxID=151549 RepID=A0A4C1UH62_EUMVA|nr:hypothetical protein EVAR_12225_1 [Eumeta japonica]